MKILHVLDHSLPLHSGYTFRTRNILLNQHALGWQTAHVTSTKHSKEGPDPESIDGLTFYRSHPGWLAKLPLLNQWDVVASLAKRLDEVIELEKPDILHAHSPALNGLAALKAGKKHQLPVVYECRAFWEDAAVDHGTTTEDSLRYKITRAMETHVFNKADAVTCICHGLRDDIVLRGVDPDKVTVVPNAVNLEDFSVASAADEQLRAELSLGEGPILGFLGSFYAYEGLDIAIAALAEISESHPEVKLLLVGGGPQEDNLKDEVKRASLENTVIFTGRVPHDQVQKYYDLIDILVYPRKSMRLTDLVTPLKPLEAMARRRLVIASNVGGHKELIRDGETGLLFEADKAKSLADAVLQLLNEKDRWDELRDAGRTYVEEVRNWPNSIAHYQDVYAELVDL